MNAIPASDAIAANALVAEVEGMVAIHAAGPCAYCGVATQMVNGVFLAVEDGKRHTCPEPIARRLGRRYVLGEFALWPLKPTDLQRPVRDATGDEP